MKGFVICYVQLMIVGFGAHVNYLKYNIMVLLTLCSLISELYWYRDVLCYIVILTNSPQSMMYSQKIETSPLLCIPSFASLVLHPQLCIPSFASLALHRQLCIPSFASLVLHSQPSLVVIVKGIVNNGSAVRIDRNYLDLSISKASNSLSLLLIYLVHLFCAIIHVEKADFQGFVETNRIQ